MNEFILSLLDDHEFMNRLREEPIEPATQLNPNDQNPTNQPFYQTSNEPTQLSEANLLDQVFEDQEFRLLFDSISSTLNASQKRSNDDEQCGGAIPSKKQKQDSLYSLTNTSTKFIKKFNCMQKQYDIDIHFDNMATFAGAMKDIKKMFEQLHQDFVNNIPKTSKIKLVFEHELFPTNIYFPFLSPDDLTSDMILHNFDRIVQSYKLGQETIQQKHSFKAKVMVVDLPSGSGMKNKTFEQFLHKSRSIKLIKNNDSLCLLRAVIVAIACHNKEKNVRNLIARPTSKDFMQRLRQLSDATGIYSGPCGLKEIKIIEDFLNDYQIMVVEGNFKLNREPIYLYKDRKFSKFIYLGLEEEHYFVITSMTAFLGKSYYCHYCKTGFNQLGQHTCENTCDSCYRIACDKTTD